MWISTWGGWALFFIVVQIIHFVGTWRLYEKAGRKAWEAGVPIYNAIILLKIIGRPVWWVVFLFLPILSPIMIIILWVDFIRCYGKKGLGDTLLVIFTLGFYIYYLNYVEKPTYEGPEKRKETFISAILFAVVLATTIHTYLVQPMIVPTGSMENTIKIGDALFVSKNVYGTRLPNTPIAVPFADLFSRNLFIEKLQLPYTRIPGWREIKKNDIVVFNFPTDSVYTPLDRKDTYVKRCVGTPGDTIQIKNGVLYVNSKKFIPKKDGEVQGEVELISKTPLSVKYLQENLDQVPSDYSYASGKEGYYYTFKGLTNEMFEQLKNNPNIIDIKYVTRDKDFINPTIFPKGAPWNADWYGPYVIPKKGMTIPLNLENLGNYIDVIKDYEDKNLEVKDGKIFIDGKPTDTYTFTKDYYFMMGDNRHNSYDSRFFGVVPDTHIVGEPIFRWANLNNIAGFEAKNGWHWKRWFTSINNGVKDKTSYLWIGVIILILFFGWDFIFRRKKKK